MSTKRSPFTYQRHPLTMVCATYALIQRQTASNVSTNAVSSPSGVSV